MLNTPRASRSVLYLPASNSRAIAKAATLPCDAVILDLEDAVSPEEKETARTQAIAVIAAGSLGGRELVVRVNSLDTVWGGDDLDSLRGAGAQAVLLPKVDRPDDLRDARHRLGEDGPKLWAMVETCTGVANLQAIGKAAAEVALSALVFGSNDLAKEMRCRPGPGREPFFPVFTQIILAARRAGLIALDGVCNALDDPDQLEAECRQALAWGFDGKTLIHPNQVALANGVFSRSEEDRAWAARVVEAFAKPEAFDKGALRVDGRMVERLHLQEAERMLAVGRTAR